MYLYDRGEKNGDVGWITAAALHIQRLHPYAKDRGVNVPTFLKNTGSSANRINFKHLQSLVINKKKKLVRKTSINLFACTKLKKLYKRSIARGCFIRGGDIL